MSTVREPYFKVRRSKVHGLGAFATRRIRKGARICEYVGERVSHKEADRRYESKADDDNHTFLFIVDRGVVIDGGVDGNDSRFINHGCDPNCESVIENRRVFIEATRTIEPGEELKYDYSIGRDDDDPPNVDEVYACRCGAPKCRGTMLWPAKRPQKRKKKAAGKKQVAQRHAHGRTADHPVTLATRAQPARGKGQGRGKGKGKGKRPAQGGRSASSKRTARKK